MHPRPSVMSVVSVRPPTRLASLLRSFTVTAGAAVLLAAIDARADVTPPGGETCTFEKVWGPDEACESCGTNREAPAKCEAQYADSPFTKRCQTSGATVWSEIWCKPEPGNPGRRTGCGCTAAETALLPLAVLFARRRRAR